jgi:hypothetical protein
MTKKSENLATKPVFARLKPSMTREQMKQNLIIALEKSGFTIKPSVAPTDKGGSA